MVIFVLFFEAVDPAGFGLREGVGVGEVGFDVEYGGAVEEVEAPYLDA
eukprot:CAMPEP_0118906794 /NCGR_PEP_ID=MMETSP1166-20130328/10518_1 /TAXON_ID=1104430 /ORGANISM="Chrysoreinhardia sp, Strain CCMP3193" /LENGTH=47 /DNA_ID= /DNA_START= /DNA_END= /DNA_ORIENTATION=